MDRQPILEVVKNYDSGNRKALSPVHAVANTYEGESEVLYRVFAQEPNAVVSCMDVVFSKGNASASRGAVLSQGQRGLCRRLCSYLDSLILEMQ